MIYMYIYDICARWVSLHAPSRQVQLRPLAGAAESAGLAVGRPALAAAATARARRVRVPRSPSDDDDHDADDDDDDDKNNDKNNDIKKSNFIINPLFC